MKATSISLVALLLVARSVCASPITSTLDVHYDGTNVTTGLGSVVTSWNNQGLMGAAANATPPATQPTLVTSALNGQNVVDFAGTPTTLETSVFSVPLAQPNHVFLVFSRDAADAGTASTVFDGLGSQRHFFHIQAGNDLHIYAGASSTGGAFALTTGIYRIASGIYDGASSQIDINAAPYFTPADIGAQPLGGVGLGNSPPNGNPVGLDFEGQIAEVAVYSTRLNTAEQKIVENYLSAKYNVGGTAVLTNNTLGANDHYVGDLASNSNYDSDVFGIGRVNVTNQLTTSENNAGLQLIGDGTLGDSEWVLAGHKTAINAINPDGSWARVWYVDKTSTDGVNATLTFDFSEAGLTPPSLIGAWTQINLLYSPTDPFNFSTLIAGGTVSGDMVSFFVPNAQLLDGYYTLQVLLVPEPSTGLLLSVGAIGLVARRRRRRSAA